MIFGFQGIALTSEFVYRLRHKFYACNPCFLSRLFPPKKLPSAILILKPTERKNRKLKKAENHQEIRKTEVLHIRLTPDDKQLIKQYASMMNVSMAKFIEILLHRRRVIICENFPELIYHLAKIGTNINQIAHTANATQNVSQEQIESVKLLMRQAYGQLESFVKLYTEKDPNPPKSIGLHTGKAINNLADSVRRLEKRIEQIEKKC